VSRAADHTNIEWESALKISNQESQPDKTDERLQPRLVYAEWNS
ncbi:MAG: hypothetical protein QOJ99_5636, partial [Bryobacterales bacterium]|nr:hypothetical protein [Bryobacterales bacterium]